MISFAVDVDDIVMISNCDIFSSGCQMTAKEICFAIVINDIERWLVFKIVRGVNNE
jgi:hypothetical protein